MKQLITPAQMRELAEKAKMHPVRPWDDPWDKDVVCALLDAADQLEALGMERVRSIEDRVADVMGNKAITAIVSRPVDSRAAATERLVAAARAVHDEYWCGNVLSSLHNSPWSVAAGKHGELHEALAALDGQGAQS